VAAARSPFHARWLSARQPKAAARDLLLLHNRGSE
jgi:hypothetical protein